MKFQRNKVLLEADKSTFIRFQQSRGTKSIFIKQTKIPISDKRDWDFL